MKIQSYRLKKKRCKKDKNKSELFLFSPLMTPSSTFSQAKQKKSNTKTKTKVNVEGKKQKYFCLFQRLFQVPHFLNDCSSLCSTTGPWSRCTVKLKLIHYTTLLFLHCALFYFLFIFFYIAPPLFLHFYSFLLCTLLFFNVCPSFLHLCVASYSFYTASYFLYILPCVFVCVFFTLCPVFINRITNHRLQILWIIKKQKCRSWKRRELIKYQQPL